MSDGDDERAAEIVGACRERIERGERVDVEAVLREHPDLAPRIARSLGGLRLLDRVYADPPTESARRSRAGETLGAYRLVRELGAGGMGTVWLATVEATAAGMEPGARVAVKLLHPHLRARTGFLQRFLREAEIGRRVRHANVVRTLDAGEHAARDERVPFLVMEYVEGQTLRALLGELGRVPEELCRHVGREIARALAAIHAEGAVHRDLKPDNVLITKDHVVKVMDLGVARVADDEVGLSQTGAFVGSLRYGAPEQFTSGREIDGRADLHALGLVLYELATASHPFVADDVAGVIEKVLHATPRRAGEVHPQLTPFFEELVAQLLAKDREDRPADAASVARILAEGETSTWWKERSQAIRHATRRPLRRIKIPRETALYGREAELLTLRGLYERARSGEGAVLLVEGEAGIGKSRLLDEFISRLDRGGEEIHCLVGGYPPGGAATSRGAFSSAYREHFGGEGSARWLSDTPILVPAFDALLRGTPPPGGAEPLTKDSLQTCFVHATRALAAERVTIVLIDDLHFAPHEGRALFAALALAVPHHRILLIGTARPGIDERWLGQLGRLGALRLSLPRLAAADLVRVLTDSLSSQRLAEELAGRIAVKSDGNPFFVFEILRGLREGKFLARRPDGTWVTTQEIREIEVPPSIREIVQARVADLDEGDRNLLDVASCVGFEFDARLAGEVLGVGPIPTLQRLARIEKTYRLVHSAGPRFVFDHHQVQETLYAGLSEPLREEYHAAIGAALEAQAAAAAKEPKDLDGALCVDLAEHLLAGAQGPRALRYLGAALTHLEKNYLNDVAVRVADRALAAPGLLAGAERCDLLRRKAERLDVLSRREAERAALEEALALAEAAGDSARLARTHYLLARHLYRVSRFHEAETVLGRALELARVAGERRLAASVMGTLGNVLDALSQFAEAQAQHESSLALSREIGHRRGEASATTNLGIILCSLCRFAEAQSQHERCLAICREIGDRRGEAAATQNLGAVFRQLGRYAEAQEWHERSLELARDIGDRQVEVAVVATLGGISEDLGRYADAQSQFERTLTLAREIGDRQWEACGVGSLGNLFHCLGRLDEAQGHSERQLALLREIGSRQGEAIALVNLGPVRLELGDGRGARRALDVSLAICREIGTRYPEGYALAGLAAAADEECDAAGARRLAEEALALRRAIGHGDGVADSLLQVADLRRRAGDADGARAAAEEALALARGQGRKAVAASCLALLATLPGGDANAAGDALAEAGECMTAAGAAGARFLLWQATGDGAHLAEAKRLVDFLVEHAPADRREAMLSNVRLHREIVAAAREQGLA